MNMYISIRVPGKKQQYGLAQLTPSLGKLSIKFQMFSELGDEMIIDLSKITDLSDISVLGTTQYSFYYEDKQFIFYETGLGTQEFLYNLFHINLIL